MKSVDEKIMFINIYNFCKNYVMTNQLYLVHILIYMMDIYKTPNFTKCFHIIFIIIVNYYSVMSYFHYVSCVTCNSQDIILLSDHVFQVFRFIITAQYHFTQEKEHRNVTCQYNFQKTKDSEKSERLQLKFRYAPFKGGPHRRLVYQMSNTLPSVNTMTSVLMFAVQNCTNSYKYLCCFGLRT